LQTQADLLSFFLDIVTDELGVHRASVMLMEPDGYLRIAAAHGLDEEIIRTTQVRAGEGIAGRVLQTGKPVYAKDGLAHSVQGQGSAAGVPGPFLSVPIVLSMPIRSAAGVI